MTKKKNNKRTLRIEELESREMLSAMPLYVPDACADEQVVVHECAPFVVTVEANQASNAEWRDTLTATDRSKNDATTVTLSWGEFEGTNVTYRIFSFDRARYEADFGAGIIKDDSEYWVLIDVLGSTNVTVPGLIPGWGYEFRVVPLVNGVVVSGEYWGEIFSGGIIPGLAVNARTVDSVTLTWTDDPLAGGEYYILIWDNTFKRWVEIYGDQKEPGYGITATVSGAVGVRTAIIKGLTSDTTYTFWVLSALDGATEIKATTVAVVPTPPPVEIIDNNSGTGHTAISGARAHANSAKIDSVTVNWAPTQAGHLATTSVDVEVWKPAVRGSSAQLVGSFTINRVGNTASVSKVTGDIEPTVNVTPNSNPARPPAFSISISGLEANTRYTVKMQASDGDKVSRAVNVAATTLTYVAPRMMTAQMGLTNARINWSLPTVTLNDQGNLAHNNRAPSAAQLQTLDQRAATTHFQIVVLERFSGNAAGNNISVAQFNQWLTGTLPRNAQGQLTDAARAIHDRLEATTLITVNAADALIGGNNANPNRVNALNYATTITGLEPSKRYMVFVFATSSTLDVDSVASRQEITMPGNTTTKRAALNPTLRFAGLPTNAQWNNPEWNNTRWNANAAQKAALQADSIRMGYNLGNRIDASLINMTGATMNFSMVIAGSGTWASTHHLNVTFNAQGVGTATIGTGADARTLTFTLMAATASDRLATGFGVIQISSSGGGLKEIIGNSRMTMTMTSIAIPQHSQHLTPNAAATGDQHWSGSRGANVTVPKRIW